MNFMNMFSSIKLQQNDDILKERFKDRVFLVKGVKWKGYFKQPRLLKQLNSIILFK